MTEGLQFVTLRSGERVPALGQGTWHMGEHRRRVVHDRRVHGHREGLHVAVQRAVGRSNR